jgi:hypothetical protein
MARFELENIDRDFFWELVDEGYASYSIIDAYLYMLSQKLSKDTDIRFTVENGYLHNDEIGFKIPTSTITTYDNLLKDIEKFLKENSTENEYNVDTNKLASQWGYSFSNTSMTPYFEGVNGNNCKWHAYDDYSQKRVFEAFYFAMFGEYHTTWEWAFDVADKYLVQDNWNEKFHYKGQIKELDNLSVTFAKNGNITVKAPNKEFIDKLEFFYTITDPKKKNHEKW